MAIRITDKRTFSVLLPSNRACSHFYYFCLNAHMIWISLTDTHVQSHTATAVKGATTYARSDDRRSLMNEIPIRLAFD